MQNQAQDALTIKIVEEGRDHGLAIEGTAPLKVDIDQEIHQIGTDHFLLMTDPLEIPFLRALSLEVSAGLLFESGVRIPKLEGADQDLREGSYQDQKGSLIAERLLGRVAEKNNGLMGLVVLKTI